MVNEKDYFVKLLKFFFFVLQHSIAIFSAFVHNTISILRRIFLFVIFISIILSFEAAILSKNSAPGTLIESYPQLFS